MTESAKRPRDGVGRPLMTALALIGLTVAGFGVWFWTAPVSGAVIAEGRFKVDGSVKTVQHLEGGIVTELLVRDGDHVAAGDVLLRLDVTDALAIHASLLADRDALLARRARLEAELHGANAPDFRALTDGDRPVSGAAVASQKTLFEARREERLARSEMLEGTLRRLDIRHDAQLAELDSLKAQLRLATEDTDAARQLADSGLVTRLNLNGRERELASLTGAVASVTAGIAETEAARNEARLDHARQQTQYISAISKELAEVSAGLAELEPRIGAEAERIRRAEVTAPMAGTVVDLKLATIGGVLAPGEPVLDIVPSDGTLVAEARLAPAARERMRVGMPVELRLPGVRSRKERGLDGEITLISAEITEDPDGTGKGDEPSYEVRIALHDIPEDIHIEPGMPVTSVIATDARTALDYLISPLTDAIARSMREQ